MDGRNRKVNIGTIEFAESWSCGPCASETITMAVFNYFGGTGGGPRGTPSVRVCLLLRLWSNFVARNNVRKYECDYNVKYHYNTCIGQVLALKNYPLELFVPDEIHKRLSFCTSGLENALDVNQSNLFVR